MRESIKIASRILGLDNVERTVHLYLYARWPMHYLYYLANPVGLVEKYPDEPIPPEVEEMIRLLAMKVARDALSTETSTYHAKIVPLAHAEDLVTIEEEIELHDLERVIPYTIARDIVMVNPQNIAVIDCPCRLLMREPCLPINVCLAVGDPFASLVIENELPGARKISSEEAINILREEDERGHVHTAYFKDVTGGRFYAICNCCPCCCIGMKAWTRFGTPVMASSGYVAEINEECTGCGECVEICPFGALSSNGTAAVDEEKCMGCGVCESACEFQAIHLRLEPSSGEPLDINRLLEERENPADKR